MNLTATSRSNYFAVRDFATFAAAVVRNFGTDITIERDDYGRVCLLASNDGVWPTGDTIDYSAGVPCREAVTDTNNPDDHECADCGFPAAAHTTVYDGVPALVAAHLTDDHVAVFISVSHEGCRYAEGVALAINNRGETARVTTDNIYDLAASLGSVVTRAEC